MKSAASRSPSGRLSVLLFCTWLGLAACRLPAGPSAELRPSPAASPAPVATASAASSPTPGLPSAIEAFVPTAEAFVEAHRGLRFKSSVAVRLLEDSAFTARLRGKTKNDQAQLQKETKVLRALGLISGPLDLGRAEDQLLGGSVVGYYDPKSAELVVRGGEVTPAVRMTLVHELTHALQDQYFNLEGVTVSDDDESGVTTKAVIEGDAVRIEREYFSSLSASEQAAIRQDQRIVGGVPSAVPPVLIEIFSFPYLVGPSFDQAVLQSRGQAGLDRAFQVFPTTSSQLLHPEKFLAGDGAHPVDSPPAEGELIDHGVLGEMGLQLLLEGVQRAGLLSSGEARAATAGWGGDQYVAWDRGPQTCVRTRFVMDTPAATLALLGALRKLASSRDGVTVEGTGPVTLTSCA